MLPNIKTMGVGMVRQVQEVMQLQYGHTDTGMALPEGQMQALIVGISFKPFVPIN